ncbi:MAG: ATP-dependent Clp protease ATP-binding subunit ClpX, partial [Planctomycetota bacterium]
ADIVRKRLGKRRIGFGSDVVENTGKDDSLRNVLAQVVPEDVLEFGMIPELVGRLPILCPLMPLDRAAMMNILTEPRNALVKQFQHFFRLEGAELEFTPAALELIAERALQRRTGARALRAVMDEIMLDLMYHLPEMDNVNTVYVLDEHAISERKPLTAMRRRARESA